MQRIGTAISIEVAAQHGVVIGDACCNCVVRIYAGHRQIGNGWRGPGRCAAGAPSACTGAVFIFQKQRRMRIAGYRAAGADCSAGAVGLYAGNRGTSGGGMQRIRNGIRARHGAFHFDSNRPQAEAADDQALSIAPRKRIRARLPIKPHCGLVIRDRFNIVRGGQYRRRPIRISHHVAHAILDLRQPPTAARARWRERPFDAGSLPLVPGAAEKSGVESNPVKLFYAGCVTRHLGDGVFAARAFREGATGRHAGTRDEV